MKACCAEVDRSRLHAGVKARSILLVLQASLGQVNGKHTGDSNQAGDPPIDQFGRQTGRGKKKRRIVTSEQVEMRRCCSVRRGAHLICLSAIYVKPRLLQVSVRVSCVVSFGCALAVGLIVLCQLVFVHLLCLLRGYLRRHRKQAVNSDSTRPSAI